MAACLLEQPNKLMMKLGLSVDDQDMRHVKPTFCAAQRFQDCGRTYSLLVFLECFFDWMRLMLVVFAVIPSCYMPVSLSSHSCGDVRVDLRLADALIRTRIEP